MAIRSVLDDRALQVVQPGTNGQPQFQKPILPDVDMGGFLDRERKTRRVMIENGG